MRLRYGVTLLPFSAALVWALPGSAQVAVDWQVTVGASVGVTDNVANTPEPPDDPPEGTIEPQPDGFGSLTPSVEVTFESPGATQSLGWAFGYNFFFTHPEANTFSNALFYGVRAPVSPAVELAFGVTGSQTNLSTFNLVTSSANTPVTPNTGGDSLLFSAGVSQGISVEMTESSYFYEAASFGYTHTWIDPGDDARTYVASGSLGFSKQFEYDTLLWDLGTTSQITPEQVIPAGTQNVDGEVTTEDTTLPQLVEVLHGANMNWARQWSDDWSTLLGIGAIVGYDAAAEGDDFVVLPHPTWRAALNYGNTLGTAALSYEHTVQPNLLLRQVTANDNVALVAAMPIPRSEFDVGASGGYQVARAFLPTTGFGPPSGHTFLADASVGWIPNNWFVRLELRYSYNRQIQGVQEEGSNLLTPDLERHMGLLTAQFGYPDSPTAGGAAPFVVVPAASANAEIILNQAPKNEAGVESDEREDKKKKKEERDKRGGSGD
jgi:hypothetical protein